MDSKFLRNTYFQDNMPATRVQLVLVQWTQDVHVSTGTKIDKVRLISFMKTIVVSIYIFHISFYLLLNNIIKSTWHICIQYISLLTSLSACISDKLYNFSFLKETISNCIDFNNWIQPHTYFSSIRI